MTRVIFLTILISIQVGFFSCMSGAAAGSEKPSVLLTDAGTLGVALQGALGFLDSAEDRARVRLAAAETLMNLGKTSEATIWLAAASLEVATVNGEEQLFDLHLRTVRVLGGLGRTEEALARLDAWEKFTTRLEDPLAITSLTARLAEAFHKLGYNDRALKALENLVRLMEMVEDPNGLASILCIRAKVLTRLGEMARADKALEAARGQISRVQEDMMLPDGTPLPAPFLRANLGRMIMDVMLDMGRLGAAEQQWQQVLADLQRVDYHGYADDLHQGLAEVSAKRGDTREVLVQLNAIGDFSLQREARADAVRALITAGNLLEAMKLCEGITASPLFDEALLELAVAREKVDGLLPALAVLEEVRTPVFRMQGVARLLGVAGTTSESLLMPLLAQPGKNPLQPESGK